MKMSRKVSGILSILLMLNLMTGCSKEKNEKISNPVISSTECTAAQTAITNKSDYVTFSSECATDKADNSILIYGKQYDCNTDTIIINGTTPGDGILSEEEYASLQEMKNLKTLKVDIGNEKDYHYISCISTLTTVSIPYSVVTGEGLEALSKMPYLETLVIKIDNNSNLECLSKFSTLKSLKIYYDDAEALTVDYKKAISGLQQLDELYLNCFQIDDLNFLEQLENLKILDLSENYIKDISVLEKISELKELNLSYNDIEDISSLFKLQSLNTLYISGNDISPEQIDKLKEALPLCDIIY